MEAILKFKIRDKVYGIDADEIEHILEIPSITPIPLSDNALKGVTVIHGNIISVLDLSELLNIDNVQFTKNSRLLVLKDIGFLVEEVKEIKTINKENFEEADDEFLVGFLKEDNEVVQILNLDKLFSKVTIENYKKHSIDFSHEKEKNEKILNEKRFLFFKSGKEDFAIDIEILRELIEIKEISPLANSDNILGVIILRGEVIPVIDMNRLLGFESRIVSQSKILITNFDNKSLAFLIEDVIGVKSIDIDEIETNLINNEMIEAIYKKELVSIISSKFIKNLVRKYAKEGESNEDINQEIEMKEVVVFKIEKEEFAFDIEDVQEIIKYEKPTPLPEVDDIVEGVLNLRGTIIPIISLPKKLGFKETINEDTKIIVCNIDEEKIGFIVDNVKEILFVEIDKIVKAKSEDAIFDEIIQMNDLVILKIDPKKIVDENTLNSIQTIGKNSG